MASPMTLFTVAIPSTALARSTSRVPSLNTSTRTCARSSHLACPFTTTPLTYATYSSQNMSKKSATSHRKISTAPRFIVMRTKELRDDAIENGLFFFNRRVAVRPLRSPVLPLFCSKCSGFDHTAVDCKKPAFTCSKCAGNHETSACIVQQRDALCPNCPADSNNHFATYRGCPAFKAAATKEIERREARINAKLAARERRQPRRQFASENAPRSAAPAPVRPGVSFAAAAQRNVGQPQPQPLR